MTEVTYADAENLQTKLEQPRVRAAIKSAAKEVKIALASGESDAAECYIQAFHNYPDTDEEDSEDE